jgi:predicted acyltransferase
MSGRLLSLDAFRGFTIAAMLLVNNPGDWAHVYKPLLHAEWHGWTATDWVFPFFVFISGISMTLSLSRRAALGDDRLQRMLTTMKRGLVIVLIGLLLNFMPAFDLTTLRIPGVLQRLGLLTIACAPLAVYLGWRGQALLGLAALALYTALMLWVPVTGPDGVTRVGSLQPGEDTGAALDRWLLEGHLWARSRTWDPEGLLSTLPALGSSVAGLLVGHWLATPRQQPGEDRPVVPGRLAEPAGRRVAQRHQPADQQGAVDAGLCVRDDRLGLPGVRRDPLPARHPALRASP